MKSDFDLVTKGFLQYLEKSGQLGKLPQLAKEHIRLSRTMMDHNLAIVQTVIPLTKQEKQTLAAKLEKLFKRPIYVENRINQDILGGMFIRLGDQVIDSTLKSRIEQLREQLMVWPKPSLYPR